MLIARIARRTACTTLARSKQREQMSQKGAVLGVANTDEWDVLVRVDEVWLGRAVVLYKDRRGNIVQIHVIVLCPDESSPQPPSDDLRHVIEQIQQVAGRTAANLVKRMADPQAERLIAEPIWRGIFSGYDVTATGVAGAVAQGLDDLQAQSHAAVTNAVRLVDPHCDTDPTSPVEVVAQAIPVPWNRPLARMVKSVRIVGLIVGIVIGNPAVVSVFAHEIGRAEFSELVSEALHNAIDAAFEPTEPDVEPTASVRVEGESVAMPRADTPEFKPRLTLLRNRNPSPSAAVTAADLFHESGPKPGPAQRSRSPIRGAPDPRIGW